MSELSESFDTARAWVTLYLSSAHRELGEEIDEYLAGADQASVASSGGRRVEDFPFPKRMADGMAYIGGRNRVGVARIERATSSL